MERIERQRHLLARTVMLFVSVLLMAVGIAFSIKSDLGVSPISSLPYVVSLILPLSVGEATWIMNLCFIGAQIGLLRRRYEKIQLLQMPVVMFFGACIDAAGKVLAPLPTGGYGGQWGLCCIGIVLLAIGIHIEMKVDLVPNAGEGILKAVCAVFPVKFGNAKVGLDLTLLSLSLLAGFLFLGHIAGIREGTLASALGVGYLVRKLDGRLHAFEGRHGLIF